MKNLFRTAKRAVGLLGLTYILTGCIDGELPWEKNKTKSQPTVVEESYVSIYQASPGASNADIVVDGEVINHEPLNYGQQARYLRVESGSKTMKLRLSGNEVAEQPIDLKKNEQYSVFLVGDTQPTFLVMPDVTSPIKEGYVRIRFLNLSPDAPEANLVEDSSNQAVFSGMSFKETPEFVEMPAQDSYDLSIKSAVDNSMLIQMPAMRLYPGWTYTIMLRGYRSTTAAPSLRLAAEVLSEVEL